MERFIKNLAKGAGAILRDGFRKKLKISQKSNHRWNIVTQYDLAAERFIIERIRKKYPRHGILCEESGEVAKGKEFWLVDPIDGTWSFSKGIDQFSTTMAFVSGNVIKYGVVYDPIRDELFFAQKAKGAFLNGKRISVSKTESIEFAHATIILGSGNSTYRERKAIYNEAIKFPLWFGHCESTALSGAWVARGFYDIFINKNLAPWDYAAAALLMDEAGAVVTDFSGRPYRWNVNQIVAANKFLHKHALGAVKGIKWPVIIIKKLRASGPRKFV